MSFCHNQTALFHILVFFLLIEIKKTLSVSLSFFLYLSLSLSISFSLNINIFISLPLSFFLSPLITPYQCCIIYNICHLAYLLPFLQQTTKQAIWGCTKKKLNFNFEKWVMNFRLNFQGCGTIEGTKTWLIIITNNLVQGHNVRRWTGEKRIHIRRKCFTPT